MTAGKERDVTWREAVVMVRSDIYDAAERQRLDISRECNTALAQKLGMEYPKDLPPATPHGRSHAAVSPKKLRPVINADDPATPAAVKKEKREAVAKLAPVPASRETAATAIPPTRKTTPPAPPAPSKEGAPKKPGAAGSQKRKTNAIKRFVTARIVRTNDDGGTDTIIPKDELYQRFTRWCRENAVSPVPDSRSFSVALKNQFAIPERAVGGEPYWVNVRVK